MKNIDLTSKWVWYLNFSKNKKDKFAKSCKDKWWDKHITGVGAFKAEDVAVVLENTEEVHKMYDQQFNPNDTKDILRNLIAPYLVHTEAMQNSNELVYYSRDRFRDEKKTTVFESEDMCMVMVKFKLEENSVENSILTFDSYSDAGLKRDVSTKGTSLVGETIQHINFEVISDLYNNCKQIISCKKSDLVKKIDTFFTKLNLTGDLWIVTSSDLAQAYSCSEKQKKIAIGFSKVGTFYKCDEVEVYESHFMPKNEILIGIKPNSQYKGYQFSPFVGPIPNDNDSLDFAYGRKLMREGSSYYGKIKVEDF